MRSTTRLIVVASALTNTPTVATQGGRAATIALACSGLTHRGDSANTSPMASAPIWAIFTAATTSRRPSIFTRTRCMGLTIAPLPMGFN